MTSQASARCSNHRGFTLVELLVVIGILVLIAGLLLPMLTRAYRQSGRTRTAADLQAIAMGLEAYKQDFGDYPDSIPTAVGAVPFVAQEMGFAILTKAIMAPGYSTRTLNGTPGGFADRTSASTTSWFVGDVEVSSSQDYVCIKDTSTAPTGVDWVAFATADGAGTDNAPADSSDNGFRPRMGGQGRIYGPYIASDKFKVRGMALLDRDEKPILYMRSARVRPRDLTAAGAYVTNASTAYYDTRQAPISLFSDAMSAPAVAIADANARIQAMLGDYDLNGGLTSAAGEPEIKTKGFILWSPGPDGLYGPPTVKGPPSSTPAADNKAAVAKCDDVVNFDR